MKPRLLLVLPFLLAACAQQPVTQMTVSDSADNSAATTMQAQAVSVLGLSVVNRYPHNRNSFTEGLQYLGNNVVLESTGLVGKSKMQRVNLLTGTTLQSTTMPISTAFGEGSTILGNTAYYLTWQHGTVIRYDAATFTETGRNSYSGEGWGLTTDGQQLIMSNGSNVLTWRNPANFTATRSLRVTKNGLSLGYLNELEYAGGAIYANIYKSSQIVRINPLDGTVTATIETRALWDEAKRTAYQQGYSLTTSSVPNGIAYIPERGTFLITGKNWPTVFEVRIGN